MVTATVGRDLGYAEWLEEQVGVTIDEEESSDVQWSQIDHSVLPASCFLWVEDRNDRKTWKLPYREGAGDIDPDTGVYTKAGPVNLGALRAISLVLGGARAGKGMPVPPRIKMKIKRLLKNHAIGRFRENEMSRRQTEFMESSIGGQFSVTEMDPDTQVIKNVAILRETSVNHALPGATGRRYSEGARQTVVSLVEGAKAYIDHATRDELAQRDGVRSVRDIFGYYAGGRIDEQGTVRGDLHYLPNHAEWLEPLVESMADKIGNSIHATGDLVFDKESSNEIVESISGLQSIDLVTQPGSTRSLTEAAVDEDDDENQTEETESMEITLQTLKSERPDLIEAITAEVVANLNEQDETETLRTQVSEANAKLGDALKCIDDFEVKEAVTVKEAKIITMLDESKLPKESITEAFKESLRKCSTDDEIGQQIADRQKLVESSKDGVHGMGDDTDIDESNQTAFEDVAKELLEGARVVEV